MRRCAILSMDNLEDFEVYDDLIDQPMFQLGWQTERVSWRDSSVNWSNYDAVIIRSPWDYQDDMPAFLQVLEKIEQSSAHLENSLGVVKWNINKNYLKQLQQNGVLIVPTLWPSKLDVAVISDYFQYFDTKQIVIKPRVSANADNTFWLTKDNYKIRQSELVSAFTNRQTMIQPFIENICQEGEFSLFYFNGQYSHAILKTPKKNDFRVQEEHGGSLLTISPEDDLLTIGEQTLKVIEKLHGILLYARIDFVRYENTFALMEAELIEPSLYFNMDEGSAERFAHAFNTRFKESILHKGT